MFDSTYDKSYIFFNQTTIDVPIITMSIKGFAQNSTEI